MLSFLLTLFRSVPLSRSSVTLALAASAASGAGNAALLALINKALGSYAGSGPTRALAWAFFGICLVLPLMLFLSRLVLVKLMAKAILDLREKLSRQILATPLSRLETLGAHRLVVVLTDDVETLSLALSNLPLVTMHLTFLIGCLVYLGTLSGAVLVIVLAFMALGILTYRLPTRRATRHFRLLREQGDALFESFEGLTRGVKELKLHRRRRDAFLEAMFGEVGEAIRRHSVHGYAHFFAAASWGHVLFFIVTGLLLFVVPHHRPIPLEVLTGYVLALLYMRGPLTVVLTMLPDLSRAGVAAGKIEQLGLSLSEEPAEVELDDQPEPSWRRLELAGVEYAYEDEDGERFAIGPLDLAFEPGELVFLVGGNGSGKTTLAKLIAGLYAPQRGELRLDGEVVTTESRDGYRQLFAAVWSDFHLFETLLGLEGPELDERARRYLRRLDLEGKVRVDAGTLSSLDLSQGQRRRLALLTAYLEDRPIYLFDEWAADQDPQFRDIFYRQILPELKARGKTVFVISHDDRYYSVADRMIKLYYGKLEYDRRTTPAEPVSETLDSRVLRGPKSKEISP